MRWRSTDVTVCSGVTGTAVTVCLGVRIGSVSGLRILEQRWSSQRTLWSLGSSSCLSVLVKISSLNPCLPLFCRTGDCRTGSSTLSSRQLLFWLQQSGLMPEPHCFPGNDLPADSSPFGNMAGFFWVAARAWGFPSFPRPRGSLSHPPQVLHRGHVHSPDRVLASAASARGSNWCFPSRTGQLRVSRAVLASPRSNKYGKSSAFAAQEVTEK